MRVTKAKFDALTGTGTAAGVKVLLMKPQTFLNLSGDAVRTAADFYKVPPERIIVLFDDISLAPGRLRIRIQCWRGERCTVRAVQQDYRCINFYCDVVNWVI